MDYIDRTGLPIRDEELTKAIQVVAKFQMAGLGKVPPELYVELMGIKSALKELLHLRNKVEAISSES